MESGCNGKACVHVRIAGTETGMVNIGDKRRIAKFPLHKRSGPKDQEATELE